MSVENDNIHSSISYWYRNMVVKVHFNKLQLAANKLFGNDT